MTETPEEEAPEIVEEEAPKSIQELELEQLRQYQDKYVRLLAESENARKRFQRDREDSVRHATSDIITEFLNPLDQLEKALKFADEGSEEVRNWAIGFQMILGQFKEALTNRGVHPFDSHGQPFDPHLHEAVEMVETDDHPANTVIEELVRGYKMGNRTLRPARVKVSKVPIQGEKEDEQKEEQ